MLTRQGTDNLACSLATQSEYEIIYLETSRGTSKAIPVTGRTGPYGCETCRLTDSAENILKHSSIALHTGTP
jgi:hypothetical protein